MLLSAAGDGVSGTLAAFLSAGSGGGVGALSSYAFKAASAFGLPLMAGAARPWAAACHRGRCAEFSRTPTRKSTALWLFQLLGGLGIRRVHGPRGKELLENIELRQFADDEELLPELVEHEV